MSVQNSQETRKTEILKYLSIKNLSICTEDGCRSGEQILKQIETVFQRNVTGFLLFEILTLNYDRNMTERPKLWPGSEKQATCTPANATIILISSCFKHILAGVTQHKCWCIREWVFHLEKTVFQRLTTGF